MDVRLFCLYHLPSILSLLSSRRQSKKIAETAYQQSKRKRNHPRWSFFSLVEVTVFFFSFFLSVFLLVNTALPHFATLTGKKEKGRKKRKREREPFVISVGLVFAFEREDTGDDWPCKRRHKDISWRAVELFTRKLGVPSLLSSVSLFFSHIHSILLCRFDSRGLKALTVRERKRKREKATELERTSLQYAEGSFSLRSLSLTCVNKSKAGKSILHFTMSPCPMSWRLMNFPPSLTYSLLPSFFLSFALTWLCAMTFCTLHIRLRLPSLVALECI